MWKHAFLKHNELTAVCQDVAHEAHIIKTALRLEELNAGCHKDLIPGSACDLCVGTTLVITQFC